MILYVAILEPHSSDKNVLGVFSSKDKAISRLRAAVSPKSRQYFWFWIETHTLDCANSSIVAVEQVNFENDEEVSHE